MLIAGGGYLEEPLTKIKSENTHFIGQVPSDKVAAMLAQSDIFCLPSFSESFPTCVIEAGVCKSFVITTFRGDAKEIISTKEHGIILPDNNEDGLYQAILSVLDEKEYRQKATELCYDIIVNNYTWKHTAEKFLKLLIINKTPNNRGYFVTSFAIEINSSIARVIYLFFLCATYSVRLLYSLETLYKHTLSECFPYLKRVSVRKQTPIPEVARA